MKKLNKMNNKQIILCKNKIKKFNNKQKYKNNSKNKKNKKKYRKIKYNKDNNLKIIYNNKLKKSKIMNQNKNKS